ncbi:DEAD/DEAH box helicase family protein [Aequorivita sinensis]|uniref:DEAD/DEAH box helicase family protein n=1 Tax=Aequorivita sinensis TaxID=1382458 RepID=UPI001122E48F|nr:DEAD/DEAH box helicase family protein [Aequorivita sinensis]
MKETFKEINFPPTYKYSSDSEFIPLEFYENTFPIAKSIDLLLGYFSSNAIKVLSKSLAEFIFNGGRMRIITNHVYSLLDYENLILDPKLEDEDKMINIFQDLSEIEKNLSPEGLHFFDCLKYLLKLEKLQILPVKFNDVDLAHCKTMILYDGNDYIATEGSINFTLSALLKNSESFQVDTPWNGEVSVRRIEEAKANFERIFSKSHPEYNYIDKNKIEVVINSIGRDKDIQDLLDDSLKLENTGYSEKIKRLLKRKENRFHEKIQAFLNTPRFPFPQGPRKYQKDAYNEWVKKDYSGVFAMATGTGKTITSLNCLLQEYKKTKTYNAIILVPSIALLNQWEEEVSEFNFKNVLKVGGGNNWEKDLANYVSNVSWGIKKDLIIISTYGSFVTDRFQKYFRKIQEDYLLIADEAHNMGASQIKRLLPNINVESRIGLSATPKRIYDPEGTVAIDAFFNDTPPYTYSFSMERALEEERLTEYKYFPKIVELQNEELEKYIDISKKLLRYFDFEKGKFKNDPIVEKLLLIRKNIIHKAHNKINCFKGIVTELEKSNKLKYAFTYVPEGFVYDEGGDGERMLNHFMRAAIEIKPNLKINSYTAEDDDLKGILTGFSEGKIDMVFAMKMLDEGVDVPRAEVGVFCSSTGNPRQFIQRRGRLLRKHEDKAFATIYDMVVVPSLSDNNVETYRMERSQVKAELQRVAYFSSLSMNFYDTRDELALICSKYELNIDQIINEL